jgi:alpha-tubulin suppressor-like RCC1 family protein
MLRRAHLWVAAALFAPAASACFTNGLDSFSNGDAATGAGGSSGAHMPSSSRTSSGTSTATMSTGTQGHGGASSSSTGIPVVATGTSTNTGAGVGGGGAGCPVASCGGTCVDTTSDPTNCGACGKACSTGYLCSASVCDNVPVDVVAGPGVTCTVLHGGEVWCWGRDVWGEAGTDPSGTGACTLDADHCQTTPKKVPGITNAVEVGAGSEYTCARTADGRVLCWGSNALDKLGVPPGQPASCTKAGDPDAGSSGPCSATPVAVPLPQGVVAAQLSVGGTTACVVTSTHDVYCWGNNEDAAVGSTPTAAGLTPTQNQNVTGDAAEVSVGDSAEGFSTVCIIRTGSGRVDCWGEALHIFPTTSNGAGCKWTSTFNPCDATSHPVPQNFTTKTGNVFADHIQVGYVTACALHGGVVTCWGDREFGQSGDGAVNGQFDPTVIAGLPGGVAQLSNLFGTTAVVDANGQAWALGWNASAQVGDGMFDGASCPGGGGTKCVTTAVQLAGLSNLAKISSGLQSGAALTRDGRILVWGSNYWGEQGHAPGSSGDLDCGGAFCHAGVDVVTGLP